MADPQPPAPPSVRPAAPPRPGRPERLAHYTEADRREILGDDPDPFDSAHLGLTWLPTEHHIGIRYDGRLVAHAGLAVLPLAISGTQTTEVAGVGGVAVAPGLRRRGLARQVVAAAMAHARTLGPRHGLLFCRASLIPLYGSLGWQPLDADVHVEQPGGPVPMPLVTMWTALHEGAGRPTGAVRLLSLPM